jgi:hypothetical protein
MGGVLDATIGVHREEKELDGRDSIPVIAILRLDKTLREQHALAYALRDGAGADAGHDREGYRRRVYRGQGLQIRVTIVEASIEIEDALQAY